MFETDARYTYGGRQTNILKIELLKIDKDKIEFSLNRRDTCLKNTIQFYLLCFRLEIQLYPSEFRKLLLFYSHGH